MTNKKLSGNKVAFNYEIILRFTAQLQSAFLPSLIAYQRHKSKSI